MEEREGETSIRISFLITTRGKQREDSVDSKKQKNIF